jgi:hypothetical protein
MLACSRLPARLAMSARSCPWPPRTARQAGSHGGREKPLPRDAYFLDNAPKGVPTSVREIAGSHYISDWRFRIAD